MTNRSINHVAVIPANQTVTYDFTPDANQIIFVDGITCAGKSNGSINFRIIYDPSGMNLNIFATDLPGHYPISKQFIGNGTSKVRISIQNNNLTSTIAGMWILYK